MSHPQKRTSSSTKTWSTRQSISENRPRLPTRSPRRTRCSSCWSLLLVSSAKKTTTFPHSMKRLAICLGMALMQRCLTARTRRSAARVKRALRSFRRSRSARASSSGPRTSPAPQKSSTSSRSQCNRCRLRMSTCKQI